MVEAQEIQNKWFSRFKPAIGVSAMSKGGLQRKITSSSKEIDGACGGVIEQTEVILGSKRSGRKRKRSSLMDEYQLQNVKSMNSNFNTNSNINYGTSNSIGMCSPSSSASTGSLKTINQTNINVNSTCSMTNNINKTDIQNSSTRTTATSSNNTFPNDNDLLSKLKNIIDQNLPSLTALNSDTSNSKI